MTENKKDRILVTGAGGFIGHHMVRFLKAKGYWVRGVDIKYPEFSSKDEADEFYLLDLRSFRNCAKMTKGIDKIYNFAADMGGMGFISKVHADIMRDNVLINVNMAEAALMNGAKRILFSSSACAYPVTKFQDLNPKPLKEEDVLPACPNESYGWEKLFSEEVYRGFQKDYGLDIRITRYENTYGPESAFEGGREKAPSAICRKVALAKDGDKIEIWGDGKQTRAFVYIEDNLRGTYNLMESNFSKPVNIGGSRLVKVNELVDTVLGIAGKNLKKTYQLDKPQGVRGRIIDTGLAKKVLDWEPRISLEQGIRETYKWVEQELENQGRI